MVQGETHRGRLNLVLQYRCEMGSGRLHAFIVSGESIDHNLGLNSGVDKHRKEEETLAR